MLYKEYVYICCVLGEAHIEFCCHLARGNMDPKEPPVYEYVRFVGDFKFHNNGKDVMLLFDSKSCTFLTFLNSVSPAESM